MARAGGRRRVLRLPPWFVRSREAGEQRVPPPKRVNQTRGRGRGVGVAPSWSSRTRSSRERGGCSVGVLLYSLYHVYTQTSSPLSVSDFSFCRRKSYEMRDFG
ncbi:hypothetical protein MA16_Dca013876 [Dendrobium catenatum]|uniref:Uncharacterized protein n=1 Tax=Dendrobium catenatum TaxID=906689 RepID=A0A2I0WCN7_9ASPA|nr:hypothetical protein MA16_Dca013876 [Dendrobium catenatum]